MVHVVRQVSCDAEITEEDSAIVVYEEVGCFDVTMDKAVDVKIAEDMVSMGERMELNEIADLRPSRACLRIQQTTSSSIPPGQP
jgi:hypothetical protein